MWEIMIKPSIGEEMTGSIAAWLKSQNTFNVVTALITAQRYLAKPCIIKNITQELFWAIGFAHTFVFMCMCVYTHRLTEVSSPGPSTGGIP